jgi:hypothetical protein
MHRARPNQLKARKHGVKCSSAAAVANGSLVCRFKALMKKLFIQILAVFCPSFKEHALSSYQSMMNNENKALFLKITIANVGQIGRVHQTIE